MRPVWAFGPLVTATLPEAFSCRQYEIQPDAIDLTCFEDISDADISDADEPETIEKVQNYICGLQLERAPEEIDEAPREEEIEKAPEEINEAPREEEIEKALEEIDEAPEEIDAARAPEEIDEAPEEIDKVLEEIERVLEEIERAPEKIERVLEEIDGAPREEIAREIDETLDGTQIDELLEATSRAESLSDDELFSNFFPDPNPFDVFVGMNETKEAFKLYVLDRMLSSERVHTLGVARSVACFGESGTGKSFFVHCAFEYVKKFQTDPVSCFSYVDDSSFFTAA